MTDFHLTDNLIHWDIVPVSEKAIKFAKHNGIPDQITPDQVNDLIDQISGAGMRVAI